MAKDMNIREAWKELTTRPLVFADERQIWAHKLILAFLDKKEEEYGHVVELPATSEPEDCPQCSGRGWYDCDECGSEVECKECDGDGLVFEPELIRSAA